MCSSKPMWSHHTLSSLHKLGDNMPRFGAAGLCGLRPADLLDVHADIGLGEMELGWIVGPGICHSSHVEFKIAKILVLSRFAYEYSATDSSAALPPILDGAFFICISLLTMSVLLALLLCIPSLGTPCPLGGLWVLWVLRRGGKPLPTGTSLWV